MDRKSKDAKFKRVLVGRPRKGAHVSQ
jgi:hypothetical protein